MSNWERAGYMRETCLLPLVDQRTVPVHFLCMLPPITEALTHCICREIIMTKRYYLSFTEGLAVSYRSFLRKSRELTCESCTVCLSPNNIHHYRVVCEGNWNFLFTSCLATLPAAVAVTHSSN